MARVQPWMRLKVKADTYWLPDGDGAVYFRNNASSFRMEGSSIQSWVEKILPVFDGQHTLESLTDGLPIPYRDRICEIADILLENGYVRDVSADQPHQLPTQVLEYFSPQIEFVDNLLGSGASRFEAYRNAKVLAVGVGSMLVSLVGSLWESGLSSVDVVVADGEATNTQRLDDFAQSFDDPPLRPTMRDLSVQMREAGNWPETIRSMDAVLYVSQTGDLDELRRIETVCIEAHCLFLPAVCVSSQGIVGPVTWPSGGEKPSATWDDAWRRIHRPVFQEDPQGGPTVTNSAILANILVFELFKAMTGLERAAEGPHIYTLNLASLQGQWHRLIPGLSAEETQRGPSPFNLDEVFAAASAPGSMGERLTWFSELTDPTCGVFHVWDEGDLPQLPLAQCRVRPIDPRSQGPADLLPETACTGWSHEDARIEAGYSGIELHARRLTERTAEGDPFLGIGTGATLAEAVWRGLHQCLVHELQQAARSGPVSIQRLDLAEVRDDKCRYYLQALQSLDEDFVIGVGRNLYGLPVVWVGAAGVCIGSVGLCLGMALQRALEYGLQRAVCDPEYGGDLDARWVIASDNCTISPDAPVSAVVEPWPGFDASPEPLALALDALVRNGQEIAVVDLTPEPFIHEGLAGVFGVTIRQGGSR